MKKNISIQTDSFEVFDIFTKIDFDTYFKYTERNKDKIRRCINNINKKIKYIDFIFYDDNMIKLVKKNCFNLDVKFLTRVDIKKRKERSKKYYHSKVGYDPEYYKRNKDKIQAYQRKYRYNKKLKKAINSPR